MGAGEEAPLLSRLPLAAQPHHQSGSGKTKTLAAENAGGSTQRAVSRIVRDVCVFSVAFFLAFTAWHPLQNLESTLFTGGGGSDGSLSGTVALGITYGSNVVCAATIAPVFVRRLGAKACMLFQFTAFVVIVGANACVRFRLTVALAGVPRNKHKSRRCVFF